MHQIKVVNRNKETYSDRHDGLLYTFAPGEKGTNMPIDAAEHIFGVEFPLDAAVCASEEFRQQIWKHLQTRWGFNSVPTRKELERGNDLGKISNGQRIFKGFSFVPVEMKTVEMIVQNDDLPLPRGDKEDIEFAEDGVI